MLRWVTTLLAGALLYTALMGVLTHEFFPLLDTYCFDTRRYVAPNFDKVIELDDVIFNPDSKEWWKFFDFYSTGRLQHVFTDFYNPLPHYTIHLAWGLWPPVFAYNVLLGLCWLLAALAACGAALALRASPPAALLAGALFAFNPLAVLTIRSGSLDRAAFFWIPLLLLLLALSRRRRGWGWPLAAGVVLALCGLTNQYYLLAAGMAVVGWAALCFWAPSTADGAPTRKGALIRVGLCLAFGLLLLSPMLIFEVANLWNAGARSLMVREFPEGRWFVHWWMLPVVLLGLLALLGPLPWRPRVRGKPVAWFLLIAAAAQIGSLSLWAVAPQSMIEALRSLPVVWRLQSLTTTVLLSALALSVLAGLGLAGLLKKLQRPALRATLLGLTVGAVLGTLVQTQRSVQEVYRSGISMEIPAPAIQQVMSTSRDQCVILEFLGSDYMGPRPQVLKFYFKHWTGLHFRSWDLDQSALMRIYGPLFDALYPGQRSRAMTNPRTAHRFSDCGSYIFMDKNDPHSANLPAIKELIRGRCLTKSHESEDWLLLQTKSVVKTRKCYEALPQ